MTTAPQPRTSKSGYVKHGHPMLTTEARYECIVCDLDYVGDVVLCGCGNPVRHIPGKWTLYTNRTWLRV
jgi:hypothetical protein